MVRLLENVLLLENLEWIVLNDRSKIKLFDTLFDYSSHISSVVFTNDSNVKSLVKSRGYKINIIMLQDRKIDYK